MLYEIPTNDHGYITTTHPDLPSTIHISPISNTTGTITLDLGLLSKKRLPRKYFFLTLAVIIIIIPPVLIFSFPHIYKGREKRHLVIIPHIDVDKSLLIAKRMTQKSGMVKSLGLWAIRDQYFTAKQAGIAAEIYLANIHSMNGNFNKWHFSWAIANIHRLGDQEVKKVTLNAYIIAKTQPGIMTGMKKIASNHIMGKKIVMGSAHYFGRQFVRNHVVAPGNPEYLQNNQNFE